tara:strand:- start:3501 stop:3728 length:228 start_codon:yes stop_codon:yes gene_type:complete
MKFFHIPTFIISLAIGLFFTYITVPEPTIIYVYPSPNNIDKLQFIDKAENVFSFDYQKVKCPSDDSKIKDIPVQN